MDTTLKSMKTLMWLLHSVTLIATVTAVISPTIPESTYYTDAHRRLTNEMQYEPIKGPAKNVVFFLGDGMSIETVAAARIRKGQLAGASGEETMISWEYFHSVGASKTYNANQQVPDSAGTISAITTGLKTNAGVIGVNGSTVRSNCSSSVDNHVSTIAEWAKSRGLGVGIVSTARITHATPAGMYGHTPERNWEADINISPENTRDGCKDLAVQLVEWQVDGNSWDVAFGGGRRAFLPNSTEDGIRQDGRDLIQEWIASDPTSTKTYVNNTQELLSVATTPVLGLFNVDHMSYEDERDTSPTGEPSITQMTQAAIKLLSDQSSFPKGYILLVEGGRIDHAHHDGNWHRALGETIAMDAAVGYARNNTNEQDTLILVTADHAHTTTFGGYATKGNDILGHVHLNDDNGFPIDTPAVGTDGLPYTTLGYYNGPGGNTRAARPVDENTTTIDYLQQATVPIESETHGGQDVLVWASGPDAHLLEGHYEQNYIFHVMFYSLNLQNHSARQQKDNAKEIALGVSIGLGSLMAFFVIGIIAYRKRYKQIDNSIQRTTYNSNDAFNEDKTPLLPTSK
eukprot:m.25425 g.25425  ORF g.25425 m.25425 type:complete len:571 (-) comp14990_c0_seq1:96-1808(-)